ncbi:MAG: hypothetical protein QNJ53_07270 [Pleurocapsa sp. MO_192.B19]|nr:hypothetical protein [Pleurocapsa sp. MO_192.B19]
MTNQQTNILLSQFEKIILNLPSCQWAIANLDISVAVALKLPARDICT